MQKLPIGIQTFKKLREDGYLYVDKTKYLVDLIDDGSVYFLSRPRRFGKSLTISTFDALFSGKKELFEGLAAEEFVNRSEYKIYPVACFDMSNVTTYLGPDTLRASILAQIQNVAAGLGVECEGVSPGDALYCMLMRAAERSGERIVVLIDEYDKPILDHFGEPSTITGVREIMRDFYIRLKASDQYLRFVFMTGISKFSKLGVFSAMNNMRDISSDERYSAMLGYTKEELVAYFGEYIEQTAAKMGSDKDSLLDGIRDYYDGFSFDGSTNLYNPFSTLCFFAEAKFKNYWFDTATPSFLADYVKRHDLEAESFRGLEVDEDFTSTSEIESAPPESFLYQSGYLTVRERTGETLILDYPNKEVLSSIANLFIYGKLEVSRFAKETADLGHELREGNAEALPEVYDRLLASIPYDIYEREEKKYASYKSNPSGNALPLGESFYHALLFTMLWASKLNTVAERHSYLGRSDIEAEINGCRYVIELKVADGAEAARTAARAGMKQIRDKGYADKYERAVLISLAVDRTSRRLGASNIER